jgi:hypothetical protein
MTSGDLGRCQIEKAFTVVRQESTIEVDKGANPFAAP